MKKKINISRILFGYSDLISLVISISSLLGAVKISLSYIEKENYIILFLIFIPVCLVILWSTNLFLKKVLLSALIKKFYLNLNRGNGFKEERENFLKSWSLISKSFKESKWNNDFERFQNGFKFTKNITLVRTVNTNYNNNIYSFLVVYKDELESPEIKNLSKIQKLNIGNFSSISSFVTEIREVYKNADLDIQKLDNLPAKFLFKPNFSDIVRWKLDQELLPNTENYIPTSSFLMVKMVYLKKEGKIFNPKYRISGITEVNELKNSKEV